MISKLFMALLLFQALMMPLPATSAQPKTCTLTVNVEGVNSQGGNIGVLVFNNPRGWPEDIHAAYRDVVVPAHPGVVVVRVENLPSGTYALAVGHDVNLNHKVDKNFLGIPKEQWGMSNNPHAVLKAPPFTAAQFDLKGDAEIHVRLQ